MSVQVLHGDCREHLARLAVEGVKVHAVVTDPPYHLTSGKAIKTGFMGKAWDGGNIAFDPDTWRRVFDVMLPGAHLAAFGGTRGWHRMACAIEDAGFEIRDTVMWVYGCLDDQTKVATPSGVMPYHKTKVGDPVLCYDPSTGAYSYQPILDVVEYEYDDTAYRLIGEFGEQVVSRNHRCIVERGGAEGFQLAENAAREQTIRVPVLESLSDLQRALSNAYARTGQPQQDVLEGVRQCHDQRRVHGSHEVAGREENRSYSVLGMREVGNAADMLGKEDGRNRLQLPMQWHTSRPGVQATRAQGAQLLDAGVQGCPGRALDGRKQSGLERGVDLSEQEGRLFGSADQVRAVPACISPDGADGWLCDGASVTSRAGDVPAALAGGVCASSGPRCNEQQSVEPDAVLDQRTAQGIRAWRGHRSAVVRVVPFHYVGKVWCLRVPTGAFVAVRGGVAFPTGNSGFPKSLDISKAIDKMRIEDVEPTRAICRVLRAAMDARGLKSRDLVAFFGDCHSRLIDHWAARDTDSQPNLPTWDQWLTLKTILGLGDEHDAEVWLLNGRKGTLGDAWNSAEVVGEYAGDQGGFCGERFGARDNLIRAAATDAARQWSGWGTALKPSHEPLVLAQKPMTGSEEWVTISRSLFQLWSRLWLLLPANAAETFSALSPAAFGVDPHASAQWNAERASSIQVALSDQMDTSQFVSVLISSLNTVLSWNKALADRWAHGSTFTTETASKTTTDLRTLRFCLSKITLDTIMQAHRSGAWSSAGACTAARLLSATVAMWNATHEHSALASVIEQDRLNSPAVDAPVGVEPIILARRPLDGTVARNVLTHGCGGLNIDACRVATSEADDFGRSPLKADGTRSAIRAEGYGMADVPSSVNIGRFPANVVHDGSDEVEAAFAAFGERVSKDGADKGGTRGSMKNAVYGKFAHGTLPPGRGDTGTASRFFYSAKANKSDRAGSAHPTVKPTALMRWLVQLITPSGGTVLDPFAGSGSTGVAATQLGMNAILIEQDAEYVADIHRKLASGLPMPAAAKLRPQAKAKPAATSVPVSAVAPLARSARLPQQQDMFGG